MSQSKLVVAVPLSTSKLGMHIAGPGPLAQTFGTPLQQASPRTDVRHLSCGRDKMSSGKGRSEFPDVESKLQKPTKQSAFERQKAEAEAKRQREAAETAAVYADFVKSFDRDDSDDYRSGYGDGRGSRNDNFGPPRPSRGGFSGVPQGPGGSRRHFVSTDAKSGPGSLGPAPTTFSKKRSFNDFAKGSTERQFGSKSETRDELTKPLAGAFDASDDEDTNDVKDRAEQKATAKPTLRLLNLPPGTSPAVVRALIPDNLSVEGVSLQPLAGSSNSERKSTVAIVTLSQETPANEMDAAVSALQNRYLGYGFYLSLHRHLSSVVAASSLSLPSGLSSSAAHAFGAKPVEQTAASNRQGKFHQQQHGFQKGFAPPSSYGPAASGVNRANLFHVPVKPPQDVKTIQLINKTIEGVLEHGAEFEALLMSRPEVQRHERWGWIWDARSEGGIWYRWRLWQVVTGSDAADTKGRYVPLFDGGHAWKSPEKKLPFEYTTSMDEIVSDPGYNSSDDEDLDADGGNENNGERGTGPEMDKAFLNPLDKAKLVHLLARLPTTLGKLRKGDIARVTTFAMTHASRGADEVVDLIVRNVERPLSLTSANRERKEENSAPTQEESGLAATQPAEAPDHSAASLVGLYVVNDILSSSATSGVRHAWRFRQLLETALRDRRVFERLGLMAEKLHWGRLRAEKWKRSVNLVLSLWEGWCVFPAESQELFAQTFDSPPSLQAVGNKPDGESLPPGKWKVVDAALPTSTSEDAAAPAQTLHEVVSKVAEDDVDGEPLDEDDVMGEAIDEDDIEGEPIDEDDVAGEHINEEELFHQENDGVTAPDNEEATDKANASAPKEPGQPRRRMRAVDMFADSDGSD